MSIAYFEDAIFTQDNLTNKSLLLGEYDHCTFSNIDFSNFHFKKYRFIDCTFNHCNLTMVQLHETVINGVTFRSCKMIGLHWEDCSPFGLSFQFDDCDISLSSFYQRNISQTVFTNCTLKGADFTESNITGAVFANCNLTEAIFDNTIAEKTDFRSAFGFQINPQNNKLKKAKFSLQGLPGLLHQYQLDIHI